MGSSDMFLNDDINDDALNALGWFEPNSGVLFLKELRQNGLDPNSLLAQTVDGNRNLEELRNKWREWFLKQPEILQTEWKKARGLPDDYKYDPAKEFIFHIDFENRRGAQEVFMKNSGHVLTHEYCHYIQFIRTLASPMLVWAFMRLLIKTNELFSYLRESPSRILEYPLNRAQDQELKRFLIDPVIRKIFRWHFKELNSLSANMIREAEAEFYTILLEKEPIRFRYYDGMDHPITIHFRDIYATNAKYAHAYLEAEESLGPETPSLFPLITYYALSMPLKKVSLFNKEDFEPVHPEEAFRAAVAYLLKNQKQAHSYAKHAQSLYNGTRSKGFFSGHTLRQFCVSISKQNNWIYQPRHLRKKWIQALNDPHSAFVTKLGTLFGRAFTLENLMGEEVFSEPFSSYHNPLIKELPFPPIALPIGEKLVLTADDFWGNEDFRFWMSEIHVRMGTAISLFLSANVPNDCPHIKCPIMNLNLCHGAPTFPKTFEQCKFPGFFENWSGLQLANFRRRN